MCVHLFRVGVVACLAACWGCADDNECRSQCELAAGSCTEEPFDSFGDLESGRAEYQRRCTAGALWAFEAECKQGTKVLRSGTGYMSEGRFYASTSGAFLGLTTTTDVSAPPCHGKSAWPAEIPCDSPTVTRAICGTAFELGASGGPGITQE